MRKILATLLCCWCSHALAQTAQELIDNGKNSENVTTFGMGYHLNQYSPRSAESLGRRCRDDFLVRGFYQRQNRRRSAQAKEKGGDERIGDCDGGSDSQSD